MNDLISRKEAISVVGRVAYGYNPAAAELALLNLPAADAQLVRHGRWIEDFNDYENHCICSECGESPDSPLDETPYCPNCGARMDKIPTETKWISVNERLPEKHHRVLAYSPHMAESDTGPISIQYGFVCARKYSDITHWMPLPEPPIREKNKDIQART